MATGSPATLPPGIDSAAAIRLTPLKSIAIALAVPALLLGLILPFFPPAAHRPGTAAFRSTQTHRLTQEVVNAIKAFYVEYSTYPLADSFDSDEAALWRTDAAFCAALTGRDTALNPRKIAFLPLLNRATDSRRGGLISTASGDAIVDAWGELLYVRLDTDFSGEQANPDPAGKERTLAQGVLVFSSGPDKDPSTWKDNVTSWAGRQR